MHSSCQQSRMSWLEVKNAVRICGSLIHPVTCAGYKKGLTSPAYHSGTWIFFKEFYLHGWEIYLRLLFFLQAFELSTKSWRYPKKKKRSKLGWGRNYCCGLAPRSINSGLLNRSFCKIYQTEHFETNWTNPFCGSQNVGLLLVGPESYY